MTTWKMSSSWRKRSSKRGMWVAGSGCDRPRKRGEEIEVHGSHARQSQLAVCTTIRRAERRDPRGHSRHANNDRLLPNSRARAEPVILDAARTACYR